MKPEKTRRLETAGWKETTVEEFLNLSDADTQYIETKLALSRRLRRLRQRSPSRTEQGGCYSQNKSEPFGTHGSR
jgi:hypothetical protein